MNLHINKEEFEWLMDQPRMGKFTMGSHMYGLDDENSDRDYLIILYPFKNVMNNPFTTHHQYQYKDVENNIDYNFVDGVTFIENLVSGDATVNFELVHTKEFSENSNIGWLSLYRNEFVTYNVIKSFLGFADRDLRNLSKKKGRDRISGMVHIRRGYLTAATLLDNLVHGNNKYSIDFSFFKVLKNESIFETFCNQYEMYKQTIKNLREKLNEMFEKQKITRFLKPEIQNIIALRLNTSIYQVELVDLLPSLMYKFYESNETPEIRYK